MRLGLQWSPPLVQGPGCAFVRVWEAAILTAAVNGEDPDTYDPDAACTGDCCSCGGCH